MWDPGEYRKGRNLGKYRKWGIRVSTGKGRIWASTGKVRSRQVLEIGDPSEYRKWGIRVSTKNMGSGRVPGR